MDPSHLWPTETQEYALLEFMKAEVARVVSHQAAQSLSWSTNDRLDFVDGMVHQLRTYVLAERLPPEKVTGSKALHVEVPATWWQYFKFQYEPTWWLGWFVRRRPVRWVGKNFLFTMAVDLQRFRTYPEPRIVFPVDEFGRPRNQHIVISGGVRRAWE